MIRHSVILGILLVLSGCGGDRPASTGRRYPLQLRIRLPASLSGAPARLQRFQARVSAAEIRLTTRRGASLTTQLPPAQWESVVLPELDFPKDPADGLTVRVRVWDRGRDGRLRSYPALSGKAAVAAQDLSPDQPNPVIVRLSLQVSVREYDL